MGFFNKSKKNQKTPSMQGRTTDFSPKPLEIVHGKEGTSTERRDNVYFYGLKNIEGKQLEVIALEEGGKIGGKTYYVEPVYKKDSAGNVVDDTEQYYRKLVAEGGRAFVAVKGFFQPRDITKEKMGSKYIGGVVFNEQKGQYTRKYDEQFRKKYISITRQQDMEQARLKQEKVNQDEQEKQAIMEEGRRKQMLDMIATQTQDGTEYDLSHPRRGDVGRLSNDEDRSKRYSEMI